MPATKKPNWIIKAGSLTRDEDGKPKTYERGDSIHLTEAQAERFGLAQLERIGEADVNKRADALTSEESRLQALRDELEAAGKLQQDRNQDLLAREEALAASLQDLEAREKAVQAREYSLADAEAKAKAEADAKASPKK